MAYVEDIGASTSSAFDLSDKFDTRQQQSIGPFIHNVGSGAKTDYGVYASGMELSGDVDQTSKTDAVASNAKAGDGGVAESSASLQDAGINKTTAAAGAALNPLWLAAGAGVLGLAGLAIFALRRRAT